MGYSMRSSGELKSLSFKAIIIKLVLSGIGISDGTVPLL